MNAFNKLISTLPVLTTDEEVLGRRMWNAALEEAAKAADADALVGSQMKRTGGMDAGVYRYGEVRERTATELATKIRAMQTTVGAAATPAPAAGRGAR